MACIDCLCLKYPCSFVACRAFRLYLSSKYGKGAVLRATNRYACAAMLHRALSLTHGTGQNVCTGNTMPEATTLAGTTIHRAASGSASGAGLAAAGGDMHVQVLPSLLQFLVVEPSFTQVTEDTDNEYNHDAICQACDTEAATAADGQASVHSLKQLSSINDVPSNLSEMGATAQAYNAHTVAGWPAQELRPGQHYQGDLPIKCQAGNAPSPCTAGADGHPLLMLPAHEALIAREVFMASLVCVHGAGSGRVARTLRMYDERDSLQQCINYGGVIPVAPTALSRPVPAYPEQASSLQPSAGLALQSAQTSWDPSKGWHGSSSSGRSRGHTFAGAGSPAPSYGPCPFPLLAAFVESICQQVRCNCMLKGFAYLHNASTAISTLVHAKHHGRYVKGA